MQKMMNALMDIWGDNQFEIAYGYAQEDDPKSTLKVQTIRPNRANVTVHLELDGTVQFSWTGYVGMECAKDIAQFEETLRSQYRLEVAVADSKDKPGQSNPDFGPGGPGMAVIKMGQAETQATQTTKG
jgi:hypothetical protein